MKKIIVYLSLFLIISCTTSNKMPLTSLSSLQAKNPKNVNLIKEIYPDLFRSAQILLRK